MVRVNQPNLGRRVKPRGAAKSSYRGRRTLYIFDSPRNRQRFQVYGQLCFAHCVLAEGDPNIRRYLPSKPPDEPSEGLYRQTVMVERCDGHWERWQFEKRHADDCVGDAKLVLKTEDQIRRSKFLLMNWMALCADQNRVRGESLARELGALMRAMDGCERLTVQQAIRIEGIDPALMLGVIAMQLADGLLCCDLEQTPYCLTSELWQP